MELLFGNTRPTPEDLTLGKAESTRFAPKAFQPLPKPTGKPPFRLKLENVIGNSLSKTKMVFHTVGDVGGVKDPQSQQIVKDKMEIQFDEVSKEEDKPQFFYILGDVVYFNGAESEYNNQFFDPYMFYPAPIMAIPGNHDGDIDSSDPNPPKSLEAFVKVFCDNKPRALEISGDSMRTSMIQPNVYWTLEAPLANIIGLYSNVPENGTIEKEQYDWFVGELKNAETQRNSKAIIVTVHHPVYSLDKHHGSSSVMKNILENAFAESGVTPDLILTGHVHNYQRYTQKLQGQDLPYIVAGAGGYWHLHNVGAKDETIYVPNNKYFGKDVIMEEFCDDRHGFLRITIETKNKKRKLIGEYFTVPRPQESWSAPAELYDWFTIDLEKRTVSNLKP